MASHEQFMAQYHAALKKEIQNFKVDAVAKPALKTIYMGGGTPSTYPAHLLLDTFATLRELYHFDNSAEITLEVNPGTVTTELFQVWQQAGINRLSIGVQSLKDIVLKSLNRHQTRQDVYDVVQEASQYINNLSVDFIIGLPGVSDDEWKSMIAEAVHWPIKHISVYFLTVHEDTPLYFKVTSKKVQLPPDDALVDLYDWTVDTLQQYGFTRYEISNFARAGYQSLHNTAYWDRKPYRGFGLGACSFNGTTRFQNTKNLGKYIEHSEINSSLVDMSESLEQKQVILEKLMLGLRQSKGVSVQDYMASVDLQHQEHFVKNIEMLQQAKLLTYQDDVIRLTPKGYALENEVTLRLFL